MACRQRGPEGLWSPEGTCRDTFALMLHDRVVELEAKVASLEPPARDPALLVLGASTVSDGGAVFVRVQSGMYAEQGAVLDAVLRRLGALDPTRWDVWACQHWSCLLAQRPYVLELLVQRASPARTADVVAVGHAVVDAVREVTGDGKDLGVDACAVRSALWFIESIRTASGGACMRAWDPAAGGVVRCDCGQEEGEEDEPRRRAWTRLHGWLAEQVECTDVWHPRAPSAASAAADREAAMTRLAGRAPAPPQQWH